MSPDQVSADGDRFLQMDSLVDQAVALATSLLRSTSTERGSTGAAVRRLAHLIDDPDGVAFTMQFVDRVIRPESDAAAAHQLHALVAGKHLPAFLSPVDRGLLRAGAAVAPRLPTIVMPLARHRLRALVGHLITGAEGGALAHNLAANRHQGFDVNVNLLGEAVLGETEALRRLQANLALLERPDVDYVSVKLSSVTSQLNLWAYEETVARISDRLRTLYDSAQRTTPAKFVNLDMEEYRDLELTIEAFTSVLNEEKYRGLSAGIVLQAYLPDSFPALQHLVAWATGRRKAGGSDIKIRLVKGANLAMERVESAMHDWEQAPYQSKVETDANYKRCVDWLMTPERMQAVTLGVASHNLFDVALAHLLARERGVSDRVQFEMLQGMAPEQGERVRNLGGGLLLYTPVVRSSDFDSAITYLFRRLEENASDENFIRHLFTMEPGSAQLRREEERFRSAVNLRHDISAEPRRTQNRSNSDLSGKPRDRFKNEPDTDPTLAHNRRWAFHHATSAFTPTSASAVATHEQMDELVERARHGAGSWSQRTAAERKQVLHGVADELARRRGDLLNAMVHEASKTISEADPEISEAIDFARWYGDRAPELESLSGTRFQSLGVVAVIPPWNFPVAIPAGGVMAALAAGNGVVFKPSKETPRCAEIIAEACWSAGVPEHALQFCYTTDREVGRHLVTHDSVDGVILTGSWETANRFLDWRPDLRLFAETSGKNALVVSPHADLDLAAFDLVRSAFGHSGQKCSAASLGILIGDVYTSERFLRQVLDAAQSLQVGMTTELSTTYGPVIREPGSDLLRALTELDPGERWLLAPERRGLRLWSPGIRQGVTPGSWFHETECFGPVLGLMHARDLGHAIELQNSSAYGLTGGIHSLETAEIETWLDQADVGNAYVNRHTTGAIVQRQPFGGWKRSVMGPGFKAGGPNYLSQLGRWTDSALPSESAPLTARIDTLVRVLGLDLSDDDRTQLDAAARSDEWWWRQEFGVSHDPTAIPYEANVFRYRPRPGILLRVEDGASQLETVRSICASERAGTPILVSASTELPYLAGTISSQVETDDQLAERLPTLGLNRIRAIGKVTDHLRRSARAAEVDLRDEPVILQGRIEVMWYLREQSISRTLHRFGNIV